MLGMGIEKAETITIKKYKRISNYAKGKNRVPAQYAKYFIARLQGAKPKEALVAADIEPINNGIRQGNEIEKRLAGDPNTALNRAFDRLGVDADLLAKHALELLGAKLNIKGPDGKLTEIPDNRTRLSALELVVKLRNMLTPKQTGDVNNVSFEQTVILASEMMQDPTVMAKLLNKAKVIAAEYSEVKR